MNRVMLEITACAALATGLALAQTAPSRLQLWLVSPQGAVDGMLLGDGRAFFFEPEVAHNLTLSVRMGDPVHIDVENGHRWLTDDRDGSRIDLTIPHVARGGGPVGVPALQRMTARGFITAMMRAPEGTIAGFVLNSGEQVRTPTSLSQRFSGLRVGDLVTVEGLGTRGMHGTGLAALKVTDPRGSVLMQR